MGAVHSTTTSMVGFCNYKGSSSPLAATPFVFLRNRTSEPPQEVCGGERRVRERFEQIRTLVINRDNGPENHSHRTQFLNRLVAFAQTYHLTVTLAYYPPYHSKYHPVERCWGG